MSQLAANGTNQEQIKKRPLPENGFYVAPQDVEHNDIAKEMPRTSMKQRRGDELPRIGIEKSAFAQRQVITNKPGLGRFEKQLKDECRDINADQRQQGNAPVARPRPPQRRLFIPR